MGRRPNYGFEKRQRELRKQKKKEEKAERKRLAKEAAAAAEAAGEEAPVGGKSGAPIEPLDPQAEPGYVPPAADDTADEEGTEPLM